MVQLSGAARALVAAIGAIAVISISGCATYSDTQGPIQASLAAGEPMKALELLEQRSVPEHDLSLHLLEKGILLREVGDYAASNAAFERFKQLTEVLSTTSVSETAGSFVINDGARSYVGEPFELALLHAFTALNYLQLGDLDAARVEALQLDVLLKALAENDDGPLAKDAFALYLSGLVFEMRGEFSDALIAYRKAYNAYTAQNALFPIEVPSFLKSDLVRLTGQLGLETEKQEFEGLFGCRDWPQAKDYRENGELIFFLNSGLAPVKRERTTVIYPPIAARIVTIALPYYRQEKPHSPDASVVVGDKKVELEKADDINALARETLEAGLPTIQARAIARAVAKYQLSAQAGDEAGPMAGLVANLAGVFTERADTRSWLTLPGEIQMARILAPPGNYRLRLELQEPNGGPPVTREFDVTLEEGKKRLLTYRWISPGKGNETP